MKKEFHIFAAKVLFLIATISMVSCSRTEMETTDNMNESMAKEQLHTAKLTRAMQTARDAARLLDGESVTRAEHDRQIDESEIKFIVADYATRSESEPDTLMYVFNYVDDAGFAVVSAVGESGEMLAVTEQGHFNSMEEIENEGFRIFMEAATIYTDSLRLAEKEATRFVPPTGPGFVDDFMIVTDSVVVANYPPLVSIRWDQWAPYDMFCLNAYGERCPTGCIPVAVGQILSYYEYPTSLTLTYESNSPTIYVNWSDLKNQTSCAFCNNWNFCENHTHIAQIIRQIGEDANVRYYYGESNTSDYHARQVLYQYGYTSDSFKDYSFYWIKTSLSNGRPLFMSGKRTSESGHTWVVDGCREVFYTHYTYSKPHGSPNSAWTFEGSYTETIRLNHINWGWGGDCNGFFSSDCFNTQHGVYDTGCSHYTYFNYTFDFEILPNIRIQ